MNTLLSTHRPRRSALYVPATNTRALAKAAGLDCDTVIFDLEDAVATQMKATARRNLAECFAGARPAHQEWVIRTNASGSADFAQDMAAIAQCRPDALLVPKVASAQEWAVIAQAATAHGLDGTLRLWAMVETTGALLAIDDIVRTGVQSPFRLDCLVVGTNDIAKDTGVHPGDARAYLLPWLMRIILAARHHGVCVLDGVWNNFADMAGFEAELDQSIKMAFDGKTLIHPTQIGPANRAFSPSEAAVAEARQIEAAFSRPEHADAGVINLDGKMVERLHLIQAQRLLAIHSAIARRMARDE